MTPFGENTSLFLATTDTTEMRIISLTVMVVVQIMAFQFLFIRMSNILPRQFLGSDTGPESVAPVVTQYRRGLGNGRRVFGAVLILAALAIATVVSFSEPGHRKLGLVVVSLLSTAVMLGGYIRDARRMYVLRSILEPVTKSTASLERRSLSTFYPQRMEILPLMVFALTIALTVWRWPHDSDTSLIRILALPVGQLVFLGVTRLFAMWLAAQRWPIAQGALAQAHDPAAVLEHSREYRRQDLRGLVYARAGVVLLIAVWQGQWLQKWRGDVWPSWLVVADDVMLILMIVLFGVVMWTLPGIRKQA